MGENDAIVGGHCEPAFAPVARYWPEFAQAGTGRLPVRYLLTHQAALPAVARPLPSGSWSSWDTITERPGPHAPERLP